MPMLKCATWQRVLRLIRIDLTVQYLRFLFFCAFGLATMGWSSDSDFFAPTHRLAGVGVDRVDMSSLTLEMRTQRMIDSETFAIMREPEALAGAVRVSSPKLQKLFKNA